MSRFIPIYSDIRIVNLGIIIVYTLIGFLSYILYTYKSGTIKNIYGNKLIKLFKIKKWFNHFFWFIITLIII